VQDLGLGNILIKKYPNLDIHASTQTTIANLDGVNKLLKLGYKRVILSRELSVLEIEDICKKSSIEIEIFIHGGMCISYSGQCLFSAINYGMSGNRGQCLGSCRNNYTVIYNNEHWHGKLLKPKDLCGLEYLSSLIKCGVKCFKIQGRTRSVEYIKNVTNLYRKSIDLICNNKDVLLKKSIKKLEETSSRGLTNGFFCKTNTDFTVDNNLNKNIVKNKNIKKENNFELKNSNNNIKNISILLNNIDDVDYNSLTKKIERIYIPLSQFSKKSIIDNLSNMFDIYIYLPIIVLEKDLLNYYKKIDSILEKFLIKGFVISNLSDLKILDKYKGKYKFITNYSFNVFNDYTYELLKNMYVDTITSSLELSTKEFCELNGQALEKIVYGRIPLINMKYDLLHNNTHSKSTKKQFELLNLNTNESFYCINDSKDIGTKIYSKKIISLRNIKKAFNARLDFYDETIDEINSIIDNVLNGKYYEGDFYINDISVK
jgi:putative protease